MDAAASATLRITFVRMKVLEMTVGMLRWHCRSQSDRRVCIDHCLKHEPQILRILGHEFHLDAHAVRIIDYWETYIFFNVTRFNTVVITLRQHFEHQSLNLNPSEL